MKKPGIALRPDTDGSRGILVAVGFIFLVLGLAVAGLMSFYRQVALEPRLRQEAIANAEILARSQANVLAGGAALRAPETAGPASRRRSTSCSSCATRDGHPTSRASSSRWTTTP
jgi:hypothetical protein